MRFLKSSLISILILVMITGLLGSTYLAVFLLGRLWLFIVDLLGNEVATICAIIFIAWFFITMIVHDIREDKEKHGL